MKVAERLQKAAKRCCKTIIDAMATPFAGYVTVKVVAEENSAIRESVLKLPRDAQMVIQMTPGVIRICGNGDQPIPLEE